MRTIVSHKGPCISSLPIIELLFLIFFTTAAITEILHLSNYFLRYYSVKLFVVLKEQKRIIYWEQLKSIYHGSNEAKMMTLLCYPSYRQWMKKLIHENTYLFSSGNGKRENGRNMWL